MKIMKSSGKCVLQESITYECCKCYLNGTPKQFMVTAKGRVKCSDLISGEVQSYELSSMKKQTRWPETKTVWMKWLCALSSTFTTYKTDSFIKSICSRENTTGLIPVTGIKHLISLKCEKLTINFASFLKYWSSWFLCHYERLMMRLKEIHKGVECSGYEGKEVVLLGPYQLWYY